MERKACRRSGEPVTPPHRDHRSPIPLHLGLSSLGSCTSSHHPFIDCRSLLLSLSHSLFFLILPNLSNVQGSSAFFLLSSLFFSLVVWTVSHHPFLSSLFTMQAQFLREYKLVVVGGGGASTLFLFGDVYSAHSPTLRHLRVQASESPPSPSSSYKATLWTNTTLPSKVRDHTNCLYLLFHSPGLTVSGT